MSGKLAGFFRANLIALIALFIALGGTSYAVTKLPANSVGSKQLKNGAVTAKKIKAAAVGTAAIANDAVTGAKVLESSLGKVPSAANADSATNAANATHATSADTAGDSAKWGGVSSDVLGSSVCVAGILFTPLFSTYTWTNSGAELQTSTAGALFVHTLLLPQGATVTRVTFYYHTLTATAPGMLSLTRCGMTGGAAEDVVDIGPGTSPAGYGSLGMAPPSPVVVDNTACSYVLAWGAPASSPANTRFVGAKVEYTLP